MNTRTKGVIFALFLFAACLSQGEEIRLNFLEQTPALEEACVLLRSKGFSSDAVTAFKRLVKWQNDGGNGVNTKAFPPSTNGWFRFDGISDLSNRLSCLLPHTAGKPTLVCFDVTTMLLWSAGGRSEHLYENFEAKGILEVSPERKVSTAEQKSFSTGKDQIMYPAGSYQLVGSTRSESETRLALSLRAARKLPKGTKNSDEELRTAFAGLVKGIKQDGFVFPKEYQLLMVFYVDTGRGFIKADHSMICIPRAQKLTTIEKASSTGPFVMGEFASESDLAAYASMGERRDTNNPKDVDYGSSVIVALNDRLIGIFRPAHRQ